MLLDMEVGLGPRNIVLDGTQIPHGKGHSSRHFSAYCSQTVVQLSTC